MRGIANSSVPAAAQHSKKPGSIWKKTVLTDLLSKRTTGQSTTSWFCAMFDGLDSERVRRPMTFSRKTAALGAAAGLALLVTACGNNSSSPTTPTRTPADPTKTDRYVATMGVGSSSFYSFSVSKYGTVNVTLTAVSGFDDPTVAIGLGLGVPSGFGCSPSTTVTASAGSTPQISNVYESGVYCLRVYDVGNLSGPLTFDVTIAHP